MFNGCVMRMWIFSPYSVKYDITNNPEASKGEIDTSTESEQLKKIQNEIAELTDNIAGSENKDKSNDKMEIQWTLNTEFRNYLEKNPQVANDLYKAVKNLNFDNVTDEVIKTANGQAKDKLMKFLEPIVNPVKVDGTVIENTWDEEWSGENNEPYSYNWKYKIEDFGGAKSNLSYKIDEMLTNLEWGDNNLKTTLENIKTVVNNPDTNRVKSLQKFLYRNLNWDDKNEFLNYNFKKWKNGEKSLDNPDWMFGTNLLNWINAYLDSLGGYISKVKDSKQIQKENDDFVNSQQGQEDLREQEKVQREQQQRLAEQAEIQRVNTLTFGKIIWNKEWSDIKELSDYSEVQKQIDKVLDIEKSKDLSEENKILDDEIGSINEQLWKDERYLQILERDYELFRKNWNKKKNLESLRSNIKNLRDKIEGQVRSARWKLRQIRDNESILSKEWSKNEKILKWLAKFESKLKEKYMDLFVEKQKSLVRIPVWISESTRQNMEDENKVKSEMFDKQLNAILKFWSWKIEKGMGNIVDDPDNKSDYRKYANRIESLVKGENNQSAETSVQKPLSRTDFAVYNSQRYMPQNPEGQ